MHRCRLVAIAAPALIALLASTGCAQATPAGSAPPSPSPTASTTASPSPIATPSPSPAANTTAPSPSAVATATPPVVADSDAAPSAVPESTTSAGWSTYAVGDGHTSWSMPTGWVADIEREVVEGNAEWVDYRGLIRDDDGTPMLRFEAVGSGGQHATDFSPCQRPRTEVFETVPLGEQVLDRGATASVIALAYAADRGVVFAAGVSDNDPESACEPGILALYQEGTRAGYDFLALEIVDDAGESAPVFSSFETARAYLETDESFDCAGPAPRSSVLHADPLESALATADEGELATEVRFDALGAIGSLTISLTDGQTGEGACALDTSAAVTPGDNGIVGVAFGTGSPGPGLLSPPPFASFSSASRALELVDQDLVAVAWATVRSLEVTP